jgi:hypothetical protein
MADIGGSQTESFSAGVSHLTNVGRANLGSITLGIDAGLEQTAARWDSMTPHRVLASTVGASDDNAYERLGRDDGSYQPGQMPELSDQLSNGSDDNTP